MGRGIRFRRALGHPPARPVHLTDMSFRVDASPASTMWKVPGTFTIGP